MKIKCIAVALVAAFAGCGPQPDSASAPDKKKPGEQKITAQPKTAGTLKAGEENPAASPSATPPR